LNVFPLFSFYRKYYLLQSFELRIIMNVFNACAFLYIIFWQINKGCYVYLNHNSVNYICLCVLFCILYMFMYSIYICLYISICYSSWNKKIFSNFIIFFFISIHSFVKIVYSIIFFHLSCLVSNYTYAWHSSYYNHILY
jgi:hypothetical protein